MQSAGHTRTQNLLLISKLLECRDNASPFTLIIDSLEQSAKPLLWQYVTRAKNTSTNTVFVAFETLEPPSSCTKVIDARRNLDLKSLHRQIVTACSTAKSLVIFDTLHPLLSSPHVSDPSSWLSSLIRPSVHLVAVYHASIPLNLSSNPQTAYQPDPLTLLRFLATSILTLHSLSHVIATKAARDRSRAAPLFGLDDREEGTIQALGANDSRGLVIECELRRRSGRTVALSFVLESSSETKRKDPFAGIVLLDDHPLYTASPIATFSTEKQTDESEHGEVSFNLGLTDRQRKDREGVVLPYFDAQVEGGSEEGGRILYDMGSEDDFDDEEDEI